MERVATSTLLGWYEQMAVIRGTEKAAHDLFMRGLVKGTTHLAAGHEAVAVGASAALRPDDYVFATYRGHHHAIARGASPEGCLAELMQRSTGVCKAKGGSMHLTQADHGMLGSYAIVGAHLPDGQRRRLVREAQGYDAGRRRVLRRRRDQHRRLPRGAQPGRDLEAAGDLRVREQPLHGVHPDRGGHLRAEPRRRPGRRQRHARRARRRQRRGRRARHDGRGGRAGPLRQRADRDRGADLPALRAQPDRPGEVPPGRRGRGVAGPRPADRRPPAAAGVRLLPRRGGRRRRPRGRDRRRGVAGRAGRASCRPGRGVHRRVGRRGWAWRT